MVCFPPWVERQSQISLCKFLTTHKSQEILRTQDFLLTVSKSRWKKHLPADSIHKQAFMIPPQEPLAEINHTLLPKRKTKPNEGTTKLSSSRIDDFDPHFTLHECNTNIYTIIIQIYTHTWEFRALGPFVALEHALVIPRDGDPRRIEY